ncbi:MAG: hypothetical protein MJ107_01395 [Lachnospiraceae bacterium]|nr:hypothetical protein [Lachnospiraceae bacterium]
MKIPILHRIHNNLTMDTKRDEIPMSKYPRPNLKRDSFLCLNGKWDNGVTVPYPLESEASGYKGHVKKLNIYERSFVFPKNFIKDKVILNIGAADAVSAVYINGTLVGKHEGGYIPFSFDISKSISTIPGAKNVIRIEAIDRISHTYPYGKQRKRSGGMWYTPVTGIWKSIWLESVTDDYIKALEITPSLDGIDINIDSEANDYLIEVFDEGKMIASEKTCYDMVHIDIPEPKLWTPENPKLYDITISTKGDCVSSYFGLRTVSTGLVNGVQRILLNGKPYFFNGVLDQGYFPEGIYTPNCEEDYERDILRLKELGINTIRKHIKVEPDCFYEACDRLGMIVFQDMVNNGSYKYIKHTVLPTLGRQNIDDTKVRVKDEIKNAFALAMEDTMVHLYNFPSIVYYTIFNEGWGQFDSDMLYGWAKTMDRTRIIDSTSGWFWQKESDVDSLHIYFKDIYIKKSERPIVLSEFGGISLKIKEHSWSKYGNYGYGKCSSKEELTKSVKKLYEQQIIPEIKNGLCGCIYTQAYDVEEETNGLFTYDRRECKVIPEYIKEVFERLKIEG